MRFPGLSRATALLSRAGALALFALLPACASLPDAAKSAMEAPDIAGTRWGMVVMDMEGHEIVSLRPDERFLPASNTKLFTVAAAFHRLGDVSRPDPSIGASARIEPREDGPPDIVLVGGGDAMLLDADDCAQDCLSELARMVAATGIEHLHNVIGDDRRFPDERWAPGWSREDLQFRDGAPASALVVNSNELRLEISPGDKAGDPVRAAWRPGDELFAISNEAITVEGDKDQLRVERQPGAGYVRLYGTLGIMRPSQGIPMAVEDPALAAAWRFSRALEKQGIIVEGNVGARHRPLVLTDEPEFRGAVPPDPGGEQIAQMTPPPLIDDIKFLAKQSQNLHAEQLLRQLGRVEGGGSRAEGLAVIEAMLNESGADRRAWDFSDGSGVSIYNRVTPRMVANFLAWTTHQAWGEAFRGVLAVGGVDGTLSRRFRGTPLEGRIFAKTGTLSGTNALAGFMLGKSGKMLVFAVYANDRPSETPSATVAIDAALNAIAATR